MAKPWQRIYVTFSSLFARDLSQEAPNPATLSGAGIGRADAVGSAEYLEGGSTFNHSVEIEDLNDFLEVGEHTDRRARYLEFDRLENVPEISSALDTYADECTVPDIDRKVFIVRTKNNGVKEELEWYFNDLLKLHCSETLWSWARNLCKNGDLFLELVIDTDNPELGIQRVVELPPETLYRIETVRGRLLEFQQSYMGPDYQALLADLKSKSTHADQAVGNLPNSSPVTTSGTMANPAHASKNINACIRFRPEQVTHLRLGLKRRGFYPYGVSILYAGRRVAHLLKLMEDAMVIYRLCLTGDSRVRTTNGYRYIKDIKQDDITYCHNKQGELVKTNILHHVNNGIQNVYEVKSQHVKIKGTITHPFLVRDNQTGIVQYVDIKDLISKRHQFINTTNDEEQLVQIPRIFNEKWAKLSLDQRLDFRSQRYDNITEAMRKCNFDIGRVRRFLYAEGKALPLETAKTICDVFDLNYRKLEIVNKGEVNSERINIPKYIDENFAKLFGFMIGDGSIHKYGLSFAAGINEDQNKEYADLFKHYFGKVVFNHDKRCEHGCVGRYEVQNIIASKIFKELGFVSGPRNKRIPNWLFNTKKSIRKAFIKGLADADGCHRYTSTGLWTSTIGLCNKELIEDVKEIWTSIGLCSGHIIHRDRRDEPKHEITEGRLISSGESWWLYISEKELPKYENILSVKHAGKEEVYDITVENDLHNFIVNGIPVHNTRAPERKVFYIDIGQLPPNKAEGVIERFRDKLKKKKIYNRRTGAIDERYNPWAADEDFWLPTRPESNTRIDTLPGGCLAMDTRIPLLDGRILTLQEMKEEYQANKQNWIYSCNPETGQIAPGIVSWAGTTHEKAEVVKITFDNGQELICTPDHKFPIIEKGKVRADELQIGESIIPFNTRKYKIRNSNNTYEQIYDPKLKKWIWTHRIVGEYFKNSKLYCENFEYHLKHKNKEKNTIHHKNYDRYNNNPENLIWMNNFDHFRYHMDHVNDPAMRKKMTEGLKKYFKNLTPEERENKNKTAISNFKKGNDIVVQKLKTNPSFKKKFTKAQKQGFAKSKKENPEKWKQRSINQALLNTKMWEDEDRKKKAFAKQAIKFNQWMFDYTKKSFLQSDGRADKALEILNANSEFIDTFKNLNKHVIRSNFDPNKFTLNHFNKMIKEFGYDNVRHLKRELALYTQTYGNKTKFEKSLMNIVSAFINDADTIEDLVYLANKDWDFSSRFKELNKLDEINIADMNRMIQNYGYKDFDHLKKEITLYNHKIVAIEHLNDEIEV